MNTERIACLGLGAMGRRMAMRLVAAGYDVTVWSRGGVPEEHTATLGPRAAASPRLAAQGADVVIAMVTDDEASRAVWAHPEHGALHGLGRGAIAIESSTLTPAWVVELAGRVHGRGACWLDAPVMGSRPQAEAGALVHVVGGDRGVLDRARPVLAALGHAALRVGPTPAGAVAKLLGNALFAVQVATMAELIVLAERAGLDASVTLEALGSLPLVSPAAKAAGAAMLSRSFEPQFPVGLVAKDLRYAIATAEVAGAAVPVVRSAAGVVEEAMVRGLAGENLTAVVKVHR